MYVINILGDAIFAIAFVLYCAAFGMIATHSNHNDGLYQYTGSSVSVIMPFIQNIQLGQFTTKTNYSGAPNILLSPPGFFSAVFTLPPSSSEERYYRIVI